MNQIKQIIEKHTEAVNYYNPYDHPDAEIKVIESESFPALESDLSVAMQEQAVKFLMWSISTMYNGGKDNFDELYTRFLFEQWAEENGYTKVPGGWITGGGIDITDSQLMEQFKQSV